MHANHTALDWGVKLGSTLMLSPMIGFLCTVVAMLYSFHQLDGNGIRDPRGLHTGVGFAFWGTAGGLVLFVPGIILFVVSTILRNNARRSVTLPPPLSQA